MKGKLPLKIGVNARPLSHPLAGIGRYTLELCKVLCKNKEISLYLYSPSPLSDEIKQCINPATIRSFSRGTKIFDYFWAEFILPYQARHDGIDILWGPAHRLPKWLSSRIASVVTIHDLVWKYAGQTMPRLSKILDRILMPLAVKKADHVVTDSQSTADDLVCVLNTKKEKISVIKAGANHLKAFQRAHKPSEGKPFFLFVGTVEPRKNLINLLAAFSNLPEEIRKQVNLIIVGGKGWGRISLEKVLKERGLSESVQLMGYLDDEDLASLYKSAQFLAMPSLYEGFGLPLVEAMFYGLPILTSKISSMPEIAGDSAVYVDPFDIQSISNGLTDLITNDKLRTTLSKNAKKKVKQYNWETTANELIKVFKKVYREPSPL